MKQHLAYRSLVGWTPGKEVCFSCCLLIQSVSLLSIQKKKKKVPSDHYIFSGQLYIYMFQKENKGYSVGDRESCFSVFPSLPWIFPRELECTGYAHKIPNIRVRKEPVWRGSLAAIQERDLVGWGSSKLQREAAVRPEPEVISISKWATRSTILSPWGWPSFLCSIGVCLVLVFGQGVQ